MFILITDVYVLAMYDKVNKHVLNRKSYDFRAILFSNTLLMVSFANIYNIQLQFSITKIQLKKHNLFKRLCPTFYH